MALPIPWVLAMRNSILSLLLITAVPAHAQSVTPPEMRELKTDRPDKTESPQTVDPHHVQIELDAVTYTRDRAHGLHTEAVAMAPFNLKYGMTRDTDLQVLVAPYEEQVVKDLVTGTGTKVSGFGDITLRLKHNLWGNDGGTTALALMPFITLPSAKRGLGADGVEFGLIVPLSIKISDNIDLGLMTEIDALREGDRYRASYINSVTVGFGLTDQLGFYTELYTEHDRNWIVTGDTGLTYSIGENAQIDAGANLGLTDAADDIGLFLGISRRF